MEKEFSLMLSTLSQVGSLKNLKNILVSEMSSSRTKPNDPEAYKKIGIANSFDAA